MCSATQRSDRGPNLVFKTTRLPGWIDPPPSTTSTFSQGGVRSDSAPGLSWKAKTAEGDAAIRDSLTKRMVNSLQAGLPPRGRADLARGIGLPYYRVVPSRKLSTGRSVRMSGGGVGDECHDSGMGLGLAFTVR